MTPTGQIEDSTPDHPAREVRWGIYSLFRFLRSRWRLVSVLFFGILLPLVGVGVLAEDVLEDGLPWDDPILEWVHGVSSAPLDQFMVAFTRLGYAWGIIPFVLAFGGFLLMRGRRRQFIFFALSSGGAMLISTAAKLIFRRARPELWTSIAPESSYSFPSGHAMASMALVASLIVLYRHRPAVRWIALFGTLYVLLIGMSRLYLGVHYPSDVLAGWAASLSWVIGIATLMRPALPALDPD